MTNDKKICFILCTNDELYENECMKYLAALAIPEGFETEVLSVKDAKSMTSGYNEGMNVSDAKYKLYLHQDVFLIHRDIIAELLHIFKNPKIGMIGLAGAPQLAQNGVMWFKERVGRLYTSAISATSDIVLGETEGMYESVEVIDGFFMATQYDIPWREDILKGWDFYDVSQCKEFIKRGYEIVVPNQKKSWCLHDNGILNLNNYYRERKLFLKEYK